MLDNLPPSYTMSSIHFCHTNYLHVVSHYIHKSHLLSSSFFSAFHMFCPYICCLSTAHVKNLLSLTFRLCLQTVTCTLPF